MINTIAKLVSNGLFEPFSSITTVKPNNPSTGDIYYNTIENKNYVFTIGTWKELKVQSKNALFNKERMKKINNIFSER